MRPVRTLVVGSLLAALLVAVPSAAHAVAPSSATWSPVAPRTPFLGGEEYLRP